MNVTVSALRPSGYPWLPRGDCSIRYLAVLILLVISYLSCFLHSYLLSPPALLVESSLLYTPDGPILALVAVPLPPWVLEHAASDPDLFYRDSPPEQSEGAARPPPPSLMPELLVLGQVSLGHHAGLGVGPLEQVGHVMVVRGEPVLAADHAVARDVLTHVVGSAQGGGHGLSLRVLYIRERTKFRLLVSIKD